MKSKMSLWAACLVAVGMSFGCQAAESSCAKAAAAPQKAPTAQKPMKAMTPEGEVIWVISVWDAEAIPCNAAQSACKTAKCWQTKDGKTLCVKPIKECPKKGQGCTASEHFKCKKGGKVMCTVDDPKDLKNCKGCYAAKEVKPCAKNGSAKCGAKEHVTMPNDKKGCAKADQKQATAQAQAKANAPVDLEDDFEEDGVFMISVGN